MSGNEFVDYYELLQLSPNADAETVERIFRHLAQKYHPDHNDSANEERFVKIIEAHKVLSDPEARAGYDARYQDYWKRKWRLASAASDLSALGEDKLTRERLLSLMYVQRRRNMRTPGLGEVEMTRLLNIPLELVEFHLWYLRTKGWVERLDSGHLAITALGVDQAEQSNLLRPDYLIEAHGQVDINDETMENDDDDLCAANE
jgi:curved DNA-binding protein CbpA